MKVYLYNPESGAPIKNWYDGSERWSLAVGEAKAFSDKTAEQLCKIYGFLMRVTREEAEALVEKYDEQIKNQIKVKVAPTGEFVAKTKEELEAEKETIKAKKEAAEELLEKIEDAEEALPTVLPYSEWTRGDLISECHKRGIEIKGLGRGPISKDRIIQLLENDDSQKE